MKSIFLYMFLLAFVLIIDPPTRERKREQSQNLRGLVWFGLIVYVYSSEKFLSGYLFILFFDKLSLY